MSVRKKSSGISAKKCNAIPSEVLRQVRVWILQGATEHDIIEATAEKWPNTKARPVIVTVMNDIAKTANFNPDAIMGWCIESTRYVYQRMVEIGDFPGALRAVKQLSDYAKHPPASDEGGATV